MTPKKPIFSLLTVCLLLASCAQSASAAGRHSSVRTDSSRSSAGDSLLSSYSRMLDSLAAVRQTEARQSLGRASSTRMNPYFYRMLAPGTMYNGAVTSMFQMQWQPGQSLTSQNQSSYLSSSQDIYNMMQASDRSLANMYVSHPELISHTDADIQGETRLRDEVRQPIQASSSLSEMVVPTDLGYDMAEPVDVKPQKPKFWTVKGNGSLQFTQSYYSDNWYQGGDNNLAALGTFTLQADYDNKKKLTWTNKLELQLGFQTSNDTVHDVKVTSNLIRYTSSVGYKATTHWQYTADLQANTQIMKNYNTNSHTFSSAFGSPFDLTIGLGMKYTFTSKKERFSGYLQLSPVAYTMRYVAEDSLRSRYNIDDGKKAYHNFGPNIKWEWDWTVCNNVKWHSYMYWFTNLHYVNFQWENTITFTINKYLSSKFFFYPRFDDSSSSFRGDHGFWMLKEWLSLGLSYDF